MFRWVRQHRITILVADDEQWIVRLVKKTFGCAGYRVVATGRAAEVMDKVRTEKPALIILDVFMGPDHHAGCAALQSLAADPLTAGIPVLLMRAKVPFEVPECQRTVCCHNPSTVSSFPEMLKPINPAELLSRALPMLRVEAPDQHGAVRGTRTR
jgi:CheY-like chemotaxis protein